MFLGTFFSYAQSTLSVFTTNPDNSYVAGETLTWTVMITNNGPQPAYNVRATYAVPAFLFPLPPGVPKFTWYFGNNTGASGTNQPINNVTPVVAVGETITYTLSIKVPNDYTGTIPQVQVSYTKSADIEVINTDNQLTYTPGTQVVYTVSVINHGPEVADPVSIAMPIPAGITNFSWTGSNGSSGTNVALNNAIGLMAVNQVVTYTVTLDVPASYVGALTTQATVTSPNTVDPVPGCSQCTDTDNSVQDADIVVVNTNNQATYVPGASTSYTVTVTNNGPAAATNVVVNNAVPAGVTNFSWSGNGVPVTAGALNNTIGNMAVGQVVTYTVTFDVPAGYNAATLVSQTVVTSDRDPDTNCPQCTDTDISTATGADLVVVNTNGQTTYTPGTQTTYTITVTNNGPAAATNVNVFNAIPAGLTPPPGGGQYYVWTGTNGSIGVNIPVNNTIPTLPAGVTVTYTVVVQIPDTFEGDLVSQTVVTSNNDPNPACTQCLDVDTSTTPTVNLVITNTDNQEIYTAGSNSVYTVTLTNNGPYTASNVVVTNPIPAGITAFSWTGSNGSSGTNTALNNTIPSLAAGQTVTYTITLGVPAGFTGNLSSTASVTTTSTDPVPADNSATDIDNDVLSADIVVNKTLNQGSVYTAGANLIYTITVNNQGPTVASTITVDDAIPAGLDAAASVWTGSNGTSGTGNLSDIIATLAVGETVTYTLTIPVPSNYNTAASITNTVVVTSATPDPNPACTGCTHTATPNPQANLVTWKTNGQTEYIAGEQTVYTIVVTNAGPSDAHNVTVLDEKPVNIIYMSWFGNGVSGSGTINDLIPLLPAGQSVEYTVTMNVQPNHATFIGPLENVVVVESDTPDPFPDCPGCIDTDTPRPDYVTVDRFAYTTEELVMDVLINVGCIDVNDIVSSAGNINSNGATGYGMGYFNKNNSNFPIKDGVVLRAGNAQYCEGKFDMPGVPWNPSWIPSSTGSGLGDPDLQFLSQNVIGNPGTMMDVSYLQFDFVPLSDEFSFDFLFAANEYGNFQCQWFDVFGFLLKNLDNPSPIIPGAPFDQNLAVVPGTTTPISVSTIRDQAYNNTCPSVNPQWFGQYNAPPQGNPANSAINMRGQTKVMTASATVVPGDEYRIKLAVGDYNDMQFDTAVFIAGGSFNLGQPTLPEDFLVTPNAGYGENFALCVGDEFILEPTFNSNTNFILRWKKDGVLLTDGAGVPLSGDSITVTEPGVYSLLAAFPADPSCFIESSVRIEFYPDAEITDPEDLHECGDPLGTHAFDLHDNDAVMMQTIADPYEYEIEYYHSMQEIEEGYPMIGYDPAVGYIGYDGEVIYARVIGFSIPCETIRTFELRIHDCEIEMDPLTVHICEPAPYDGEVIVDLTSYIDEMTVVDPIPASYVYTFHNNQADANSGDNPIADPTVYSTSTETVWVRVIDSGATGDVEPKGVEALSFVIDPQPVVGTYTDVFACDSYTLTPATVGNYYTGPGGTGTQINPAVPLTTSQTVYVYAVSGTAPDTCT
ncbi:MAG: hypothetical protein DI539_21670, partial [Flavobacterium psychrophilum]